MPSILRSRRLWILILVCSCAAVFAAWLLLRSGSPQGEKLERFAHYKSITLFDVDAFDRPAEAALDGVASGQIGERQTRLIVRDVTYCRGTVLWKGNCLGVVELDDGRTERIAVSYYAGFFKVFGERGYYQTEGDSCRELTRCLDEIIKERFIPKRQGTKQ